MRRSLRFLRSAGAPVWPPRQSITSTAGMLSSRFHQGRIQTRSLLSSSSLSNTCLSFLYVLYTIELKKTHSSAVGRRVALTLISLPPAHFLTQREPPFSPLHTEGTHRAAFLSHAYCVQEQAPLHADFSVSCYFSLTHNHNYLSRSVPVD